MMHIDTRTSVVPYSYSYVWLPVELDTSLDNDCSSISDPLG